MTKADNAEKERYTMTQQLVILHGIVVVKTLLSCISHLRLKTHRVQNILEMLGAKDSYHTSSKVTFCKS